MIDDRSTAAFAQLSATNHGPLILITTYIFLISSCLAVSVKTWTRLSTVKTIAPTDMVMLATLATAVAQAALLTVSVNHGLGQHIFDLARDNVEVVSKTFYAASILEIITLAGAKASVTLLVVSIQPLRPVLLACYCFLGVVAVWMVAGIFSLAFQCGLPTPWVLGPNTCVDQYALRLSLGVVNIVTDIVIVGLAYWMMHKVQVTAGRRWSVVALFALRIAVPPFAICALVTYHTYYSSQTEDRTWHAVTPTIWTQVMLHLSIITACIPSIKRFFADVQSGLMGVTISESYELTHSGGKHTQLQSNSGTGLGSRLASRFGRSANRSHGASGTGSQTGGENAGNYTSEGQFGNKARVRAGMNQPFHSPDTESVKGLTTNVIHQKIDYDIEYEERESDGRPSR